MTEIPNLRERIVKYAAAGYRRRDIADLCGITMSQLRRHLTALGILESVTKREDVEKKHGRLAHEGPHVFVESGPEDA